MDLLPRTTTCNVSLREWSTSNGLWALAEMGYLFGQFRIQIWHSPPKVAFPNVVLPSFSTYSPKMSNAILSSIRETLSPVSENSTQNEVTQTLVDVMIPKLTAKDNSLDQESAVIYLVDSKIFVNS